MAIIKHANPCGAAVAGTLVTAYERALECDVQIAFGGVVAIGGGVIAELAEAIAAGPQADVISPAYTTDAPEKLTGGARPPACSRGPPERAVPSCAASAPAHWSRTPTRGRAPVRLALVTKRQPTEDQWRDLVLAWRVCGRTMSNAIVVVTGGQAVGLAPASSPASSPRRSPSQGGREGQGRSGGERRLLPVPRRAARPGRRRRHRRRAPGRIGRTARSSRPPTRRAWRWSSPASGTSGTDERHPARRRGGGRPDPGRGDRARRGWPPKASTSAWARSWSATTCPASATWR